MPRLLRARQAFERERDQLTAYLDEAQTLLRKLVDFLGVPESLRPAIDFDETDMLDPHRRQELQESFQSVVELNTAYEGLLTPGLPLEPKNPTPAHASRPDRPVPGPT
mgnify:CR=1 FL=1